MTYLPDVNVWCALAIGGHVHQEAALRWMQGIAPEDSVVFCRVTQHGLLRLLTNAKAMGPNVLFPEDAWAKYDALRAIVHARFLSEPPEIEAAWRTATRAKYGGQNYWTDAYLAAFAVS